MKITHYRVTNQFQTDAEYVLIDRGNDEFTTMPKEEYDRRQAEQVEHLTEIIPADEA